MKLEENKFKEQKKKSKNDFFFKKSIDMVT